MGRRDSSNLPVSSGNVAAVAAYEAALASFLPCHGDPLVTIESALAGDPEFVMGHALRAGLAVAAWDKRALPLLRKSLDAVLPLASAANERERAHLGAARAWLAGEYREAADRYAALLRDWPGDLLALRLAQACDFFIGRPQGLLESVVRVLPYWRLRWPLEEPRSCARRDPPRRAALEPD
jgi:hypothetical protein